MLLAILVFLELQHFIMAFFVPKDLSIMSFPLISNLFFAVNLFLPLILFLTDLLRLQHFVSRLAVPHSKFLVFIVFLLYLLLFIFEHLAKHFTFQVI